jgi:hypothetical protein
LRGSAVLATAIVAGSLSGLAPAASQAAARARIASPGNGGLVTGASVRMLVRTSPGVTRFRAWLGSTEITRSFRRIGSKRSATVGRGSPLRYGVNVLSVSTGDASGHTSFTSSRFVVGRRAPALVTASRPSVSGGTVGVGVNAGLGTVFSARLNGRRVDGAFLQLSGGARSARLAANHGLRFGRNRLRIVVYNERTGSYDVETRTFNLPRTRPLVGAGNDRFPGQARRSRSAACPRGPSAHAPV